jgi:hypothetical protein
MTLDDVRPQSGLGLRHLGYWALGCVLTLSGAGLWVML